MAERINKRITLKSRPHGMPEDENYDIQQVAAEKPGDDEMLLKTLWLSLDPYMRGRMNDAKSYAKPLDIGEVITAGVVSQVVESNAADYPVGTIVTGMYGWQSYAIGKPDDYRLFKVDPDLAPISTAVGVTGMPGQTAYFGLLRVGKPVAGETVVVSAASGAVGGVVGQIAKIEGAMDQCLLDAGIAAQDIELVVLTGGSSELPAINQMVSRKFAAADISQDDKFCSVGLGLAYYAAQIF